MENDWREVIKAIQNGSMREREAFAAANFPLVWSLVHRFSSRYYDQEELFQVGVLGLMKAIDKFDLAYNTQFSTYAVPIIIGEIKRFFRDAGAIKVSRGLKEKYLHLQKVRQTWQSSHDCEPRISDLVDASGLSFEDVVDALATSYHPLSLTDPVYEQDGSAIYLEEIIADPHEHEQQLELMALREELEKLDPKERLLIELRYFHALNQQEVAQRFNVSQVQISRMEKKIIAKLRAQLVI